MENVGLELENICFKGTVWKVIDCTQSNFKPNMTMTVALKLKKKESVKLPRLEIYNLQLTNKIVFMQQVEDIK